MYSSIETIRWHNCIFFVDNLGYHSVQDTKVGATAILRMSLKFLHNTHLLLFHEIIWGKMHITVKTKTNQIVVAFQ